ncbi:MAG TPA: flagellin [Candidatus Sulfotelmatobacter sp.]|nr:flagellin [Candidatus Sulfotelmatobacter sp.]
MRSNLLNLQMTAALQARTSERLATGLRVNSPSDDAAAYFAAANERSRASDLSARKDEMGEGIQTVSAANEGITAITSLIEQAKGLVASARSASTADRATLATQYDALLTQIDNLANDSGYKGTNLLGGDTLTVSFNEDGSSNIAITGFDASSTGLGVAAAAGNWAANANLDTASTQLDTALTTLRTNAKALGSDNGVIVARQDFTNGMVNTLTTGADNLTVADPNEEGANMLALQTRQQLGIAALGLSSQSQQAILKLF